MIQRIQSLYLLIAVVLVVLGFFLNWVVYHVGELSLALKPFGSADGVSNGTLTFLWALLLGLLVATIVQFKNRKQQMRNARIAIIAAFLALGGFALDHYWSMEALGGAESLEMSYGIAVVIPILCAILSWMALKAIRKDEDLVKSVDRLR